MLFLALRIGTGIPPAGEDEPGFHLSMRLRLERQSSQVPLAVGNEKANERGEAVFCDGGGHTVRQFPVAAGEGDRARESGDRWARSTEDSHPDGIPD